MVDYKITKSNSPFKRSSVADSHQESRLQSFFNTFKGTIKDGVKILFPPVNSNENKEKDKESLISASFVESDTAKHVSNKTYNLITKFLTEKGNEKLTNTECDIIKTLLDHSCSTEDGTKTEADDDSYDVEKRKIDFTEDKSLGPKLSNDILTSINYNPQYDQDSKMMEVKGTKNLNVLPLQNGKRIFNFYNEKPGSKILIDVFKNESSNSDKIAKEDTSKNAFTLSKGKLNSSKYDTPAANFLVKILKDSEGSIQQEAGIKISNPEEDYAKLLNPHKINNQQNEQLMGNVNTQNNQPVISKPTENQNFGIQGSDDVLVISDDFIESEHETADNDEKIYLPNDIDLDEDIQSEEEISNDSFSVDEYNHSYEHGDSEVENDRSKNSVSGHSEAEDNFKEQENESDEDEKELFKEEEEFIINDILGDAEISQDKEDSDDKFSSDEFIFPEPVFLGLSDDKDQINEVKVAEYLKLYTF